MTIEKLNNKQITITFSEVWNDFGMQRLVDFVKYIEITSKSNLKQKDIDDLANEVNENWWIKNKDRFIKK
jgi:hypothetical protein